MVKGISRQVIVVQSPEPKMFEQAMFILKEDVLGEGITDDALLKEAQQAIRGYDKQSKRRHFYLYGVVWATNEWDDKSYSEEGSSLGAGIRLWGHAGSPVLPDFNITTYMAYPLKDVDSDDANSPRFVFQLGLFF